MWATVVTNRRWVWPLFALLAVAAIVFAVMWGIGIVGSITGFANTVSLAVCAIGLAFWHLATRHPQR